MGIEKRVNTNALWEDIISSDNFILDSIATRDLMQRTALERS